MIAVAGLDALGWNVVLRRAGVAGRARIRVFLPVGSLKSPFYGSISWKSLILAVRPGMSIVLGSADTNYGSITFSL